MGHTMRLDKIMIWISIHLHSLPRGTSSVHGSRFKRSLLSPFHISQSYSRYHTNVLLVPTALVLSPLKCDKTKSARGGATKGREERGDHEFFAIIRLMAQACIPFSFLYLLSSSSTQACYVNL